MLNIVSRFDTGSDIYSIAKSVCGRVTRSFRSIEENYIAPIVQRLLSICAGELLERFKRSRARFKDGTYCMYGTYGILIC
jgi:hypothetical protein